MHAEAREFVTSVAYQYGPWDTARVIECGSLNVNGTVRDLFAGSLYTGVDVTAGSDVDVVCNFANYRLPDLATRADLVICCEVLEHTPDRTGIFDAAHAALKPGGLFVITCATDPRPKHGPYGDIDWYGNVAPDLLRTLLADTGFSTLKLEVYTDRGDLYALARRDD